jgi:hypothetical protein
MIRLDADHVQLRAPRNLVRQPPFAASEHQTITFVRLGSRHDGFGDF